jgi:hypothetical protein
VVNPQLSAPRPAGSRRVSALALGVSKAAVRADLSGWPPVHWAAELVKPDLMPHSAARLLGIEKP